MEITINERIARIADYFFKGNTSAMARATSIKQGTLRDIIGERRSTPSFETIKNIVDTATLNINSEWLLTGAGEMLKQPTSGINTHYEGNYVGGAFVTGNNNSIKGSVNTPGSNVNIGNSGGNSPGNNDVTALISENNLLKEENAVLKNKCESLQHQVDNLTSKLLEEKERLIKIVLDRK